MGVLIPMTMLKLGRDPAVGSSVLITAVTDSGGFFIFLGSRNAVPGVRRGRRSAAGICLAPLPVGTVVAGAREEPRRVAWSNIGHRAFLLVVDPPRSTMTPTPRQRCPGLPQPDLVAAIPRLRRYARVLTGDASRADDLVQDTLARGVGEAAHRGGREAICARGCSPSCTTSTSISLRSCGATRANVSIDADPTNPRLAASRAREPDRSRRAPRSSCSRWAGSPRISARCCCLRPSRSCATRKSPAILSIPVGTVMSRLVPRPQQSAPAGRRAARPRCAWSSEERTCDERDATSPAIDADVHAYVDGRLRAARARGRRRGARRMTRSSPRALPTIRAQNAALRDALDLVLAEPIPERLLAAAVRRRHRARRCVAGRAVLLARDRGRDARRSVSASAGSARDALIERDGHADDVRAAGGVRACAVRLGHQPAGGDLGRRGKEARQLAHEASRVPGPRAGPEQCRATRWSAAGSSPATRSRLRSSCTRMPTSSGCRCRCASTRPARGETAFRYAHENGVGVFYWIDDACGYALSGNVDRGQLLKIAHVVYGQLAAAEAAPCRRPRSRRLAMQTAPARPGDSAGDIDTPALVVDLDVFERNLDLMANAVARRRSGAAPARQGAQVPGHRLCRRSSAAPSASAARKWPKPKLSSAPAYATCS